MNYNLEIVSRTRSNTRIVLYLESVDSGDVLSLMVHFILATTGDGTTPPGGKSHMAVDALDLDPPENTVVQYHCNLKTNPNLISEDADKVQYLDFCIADLFIYICCSKD
jgi:hypothetical protein